MPKHVAAAIVLALSWYVGGCALVSGGGTAETTASSPAVKSVIPIGQGPILLAISDDGTRLYAASNKGLHIVDTHSAEVVATLDTPPYAAGLAFCGAAKRAYLTNLFGLQLAVIDTAAESLLSPIELISGMTRPAYGRVAVSPDGTQVYVVDRAGQDLVVVDVAQASPQAFQLTLQPSDVVLSPDGRWAYISGCKGFCAPGTVQRFDTQQSRFAGELKVGPSPYRMVLDPQGKTLYTTNLGDGSISVVDVVSLSLTANVPVAPQLTDLAVSSDSKWIYVISRVTNQLVAVDATTNTVGNKMTVGPSPREVVLSPDGGTAYVSTSQSVVVIDTAMFIRGS